MKAFALLSAEPAFHQDISFKNQVKTAFSFVMSLYFRFKKKDSLKLREQRTIKIQN